MSKRVRVILLEEITELGRAGDIVSVSEGYARNALFPEGKAALATDKEVTRVTRQKQIEQQKADAKLEDLQKQADALDGTELTIQARTKNDDEIFGSINAAHIAEELKEQGNVKVRAKDIGLDAPISTVGTHAATISFCHGIEAEIKVIIKPT